MAIRTGIKNVKDRENSKFVESPTRPGEAAVEVVIGNESGLGYILFGPIIVGASSTIVVDTNLLSTFSRLDYIINFKDDPITVTKSLKLVSQNDAGTLSNLVSERMGGAIDVEVDVTDDAVDAFLEITNNESYDVTVTYLRAILP